MPTLPCDVYDADNHLYEPAEAFLRHLPKALEREFYFADVKGRTKLVINGQLSEYIPNPTFEVVAAPGVHEAWYRAENTQGLSMRQMPGEFKRHPRETFMEHIFVTPACEDDMDLVAELLPANRILFGSNFPHPEGLEKPLNYIEEYKNYAEGAIAHPACHV